jgi:hypothetical protein
VRFGPQAVGSRSSTLNVTSDDPLSPLAAALSGTGESAIGKPAPIEPVTCSTVKKTVVRVSHHRNLTVRITVAQCSAKFVSGMGTFTTAQAAISGGTVTYASGTAARIRGDRVRLVLQELRSLGAGRYVLSLRHRQGRRSVTDGVPIRIA